MRRRKFVKYTRRHRFLSVRSYKYVTLYRCRACGKWARRATPGALEAIVRAQIPAMLRQIYKPSVLFTSLWERGSVSGGDGIRVPMTYA